MDWAALITAVAALATAALAWNQIRLSRLTLGVDLVLRQDERFEGDEFQEKRRVAAKALSENRNLDSVDDVLDFFETLAILVRRKAVDKFLVWYMFFYWVHGYWLKGSDYIRQVRERDKTRYAFLPQVHEDLLRIEMDQRKKAGAAEVVPPDTIWDKFLEEEQQSENH